MFDLLYRRDSVAGGPQTGERLLPNEGESMSIVNSPHIDKDGFFPTKVFVKFSCWHTISCHIIVHKLLRTDSIVNRQCTSSIRISTVT